MFRNPTFISAFLRMYIEVIKNCILINLGKKYKAGMSLNFWFYLFFFFQDHLTNIGKFSLNLICVELKGKQIDGSFKPHVALFKKRCIETLEDQKMPVKITSVRKDKMTL